MSVKIGRRGRLSSYLLLPDIPLIVFFPDFLLIRTIPPQAYFLQSLLLLRIGTSSSIGRDAIDSIISDLDARC